MSSIALINDLWYPGLIRCNLTEKKIQRPFALSKDVIALILHIFSDVMPHVCISDCTSLRVWVFRPVGFMFTCFSSMFVCDEVGMASPSRKPNRVMSSWTAGEEPDSAGEGSSAHTHTHIFKG